ncbi:MAG: DNA cytosine methyltransferase [Ardenticatenales bacterium]|nr:DNA cytosine methyltransferase [Ardenticatenales bacterium]
MVKRKTYLVLLEFVVWKIGKRAMRALTPTSLRSVSPLPTSGEGRPKAGERATTQSHDSTTYSSRTRNVKRKALISIVIVIGSRTRPLSYCERRTDEYDFTEKSQHCPSFREICRLQAFPDWFRFYGGTDHMQQQLANAVPPLMAKAVAGAITGCWQTILNTQTEAVAAPAAD